MFGGTPSASGISVTPESALRASAVHACVAVIAGTMATLPLNVYRRRKSGGKDKATEHPAYFILHDAPNDMLTSCEWREMKQAHLCLRGNGFSRVLRDGAGRLAALIPEHPDRVSIFRDGLNVTYSIQKSNGGQDVLRQDEVLHLRGMGPDGLIGYSPIGLARESIGLALATERHGAQLFGNGARPSGYIETPGTLTPQQVEKLRDEWHKRHGGESQNGTAILYGGMKWSGVTMSSEDAQFLETRQYQLSDIARIFRVPPHLIGDLSKATFSNIEHQAIEFVTHCIRPWAVRWEQRMNQVLLTPKERGEYFIEYNLEGLLRGDQKTRFEAYNIGLNGGILSVNEVRDIENLNPIEGGDTYRQPMNMNKLGDFSASNNTAGGVPST
jgi:HK97 family phage portal protein